MCKHGPARYRELSGADTVLAAMLALYVSTSAQSSPAHSIWQFPPNPLILAAVASGTAR